MPRERNKKLTAVAGAEPRVGAQHPDVQCLQFLVSESTWDADAINAPLGAGGRGRVDRSLPGQS